uniref:Neur_chan_LBD domain-containing protein n=1 Tax=Macrostomum lignano TaxID=282301 RepID=A0A1I8HZB1_9PLAT
GSSSSGRVGKGHPDFDSSYLSSIQKVTGGNDESVVQYGLFVYSNYQGFLAPSTTPLQVQAHVSPLHLSRRSDQQRQDSLTARLTLRLYWRDARLAFNNTRVSRVQLYQTFLKKLWKPSIQFLTATGQQDFAVVMATVDADGLVTLTQRLNVGLECAENQLHLLPLDTLKCDAKLSVSTASQSQQKLDWLLPGNASFNWPIGSQVSDLILTDVQFLDGNAREEMASLTLRLKL